MTDEVKQLLKDIERFKKKENKYGGLRFDSKMKLQEICGHEDKEEKTKHYSGSYLNYGSYEHTVRCKICDKQLSQKTESDGSYG